MRVMDQPSQDHRLRLATVVIAVPLVKVNDGLYADRRRSHALTDGEGRRSLPPVLLAVTV